MRTASSAILAILLLSFAGPIAEADSKGVISCVNADLSMMPANWELGDQACVRLDLGELNPGQTLSFDIVTDSAIDILLFSANAITVYQNEQSYRSDLVWEGDSVFESFNGTGSWHWTVPDDRDPTRWYMVFDNLDHPQDSSNGAQGGSAASVTLDAGIITPVPFTLADTIVRLEAGGHSLLHGPFILDAGTQVSIQASTMEGAPDVFLMTQSQVDLYEAGGTAATRVSGTDMLLITTDRSIVWTAPESLEGTQLYLVVDNRAGPSGGGAGTLPIATTVVMVLTPILEPVIGGEASSGVVDVGSIVTLDATETPNLSEQIPESGFSWDTDGDGFDDNSGTMANVSWAEPTNVTIRLTVLSTDGRSTSVYQEVQVSDVTPPESNIQVNGVVERAFNEALILSGDFSDNWGVSSVEWLVDGQVVSSFTGDLSGADSFSHSFASNESSGEHTITLRVTDRSGLSSEDTAIVSLYDSTPPVSDEYEEEISTVIGETTRLSIAFSDPESTNLYYSWDFDAMTDSDGDGDADNDEDASGPVVLHAFEEIGVYRVICRVQNEAGLISEAEILLTVTDGTEGTSLTFTEMLMIAGAALLTLVILSLILMRISTNRRMAAMMAEEESEVEEEAPREMSAEEQKAMWSTGGSNIAPSQPYGGFSSGMSGLSEAAPQNPVSMEIGDEVAELLSSDESAPSDSPPSAAEELLSAFDDEEPPVDLEEGVVEYTFDDEPDTTTENWSPAEGNENPAEDRKVRQACSSCEKLFELELPEGITSAKTACPHCGSVERVSLG
ncbi:MAG: PKD domain-containing protein [Candidatus Thermoplasmatota archaeon]|nr:PKD domain-containing protein [Candidatus Thermoplasmatota archaeon]